MAENENPFIESMSLLKNAELINIINNKGDYQKEAYEAAMMVAKERNLFIPVEVNMNHSGSNLALKKKELYRYSDIKNGLNNFFMSLLIFYVAFIIATALNFTYSDNLYSKILTGLLILICFFFNIRFFPNEEDDKGRINTYSDFAIWIAEPYIDRRKYMIETKPGLIIRRRFVNVFVILPVVMFNVFNVFNQQKNRPTSNMDEYGYNHTINEGKMNNEFQNMRNMVDSVHWAVDKMNVIEGDRLFDEKNYTEAIVNYKKALNDDISDTSVYMSIADCFLELNKKDSATYYWKKAEIYGCYTASRKLKKYH